MRDIVRRAAGSVTGKTVAAQIRQAARHLGYSVDDWRIREAWYGRSGTWSAPVVDDLRQRFTAWRGREQATSMVEPPTLAPRVGEIQRLLSELTRRVDELAAEIAMTVDGTR